MVSFCLFVLNQALHILLAAYKTRSCWPLNLYHSSLPALSIGPEIGSNDLKDTVITEDKRSE